MHNFFFLRRMQASFTSSKTGMSSTSNVDKIGNVSREWELNPESELRFEVKENQSVNIVLKEGHCEASGLELVPDKVYRFTEGARIAIYTWYGCKLWTEGHQSMFENGNMYESSETEMTRYINLHAQLEALRDQAQRNSNGKGPRVLLAGPTDSGKSSITKLLLSWAVRLQRKPLYVDTDVGQNNLIMPGCVGAIPCNMNTMTLAENGVYFDLSAASPLVYFYGHDNLSTNPDYFKYTIDRIAGSIDERFENDQDAKNSGFIVDTPGWIEQEGKKLLKYTIEKLRIDLIVVMGNDRLYREFSSTYGKEKVIKLPLSGGIEAKTSSYRRNLRMSRIERYYKGIDEYRLQDSTLTRNFSDFIILQVGETRSQAITPFNQNFKPNPLRLTRLTRLSSLEKKSILAVLHPLDTFQEEELNDITTVEYDESFLSCNVAGFLHVFNIDYENEILHLTSPAPSNMPPPSKILLLGSIKWQNP